MDKLDNIKIKGRFRIKTFKENTKDLVSVSEWYENLVVTSSNNGLNRFIQALNGVDISLEITKAMIGTGSTAPTVADTDLETPLAYDIQIANREYVDNVTLRLDFFIPSIYLPDDTYYEFGTFIGTNLFSRALIDTPFEKSGSVDVSVEYEYSISNVTP